MYKLLALDMDGTTLNSQKKITPQTVEGINRLLNDGVHVIVASGRCLAEMNDYKEELKNMRYCILASGALIYDFAKQEPVSVHPVPFDECLDLIDLGEQEKAMVHLLTIRESVVKPQDINHMVDFQMGIYQDMYIRNCLQCEDQREYAKTHKDDVIKVNIYHRSPESRAKTVERLKGRNLQMVFAETTALESSPPSVTKAAGLVELCKYLNIDIADTVAIGDAPNDIEILQTVGYAVVMGNASDEIKQMADFVTADNDHDGVLAAINKIFYS
ncbi:MAG: HAD family phosphatase [Selenomonadaceae bacterium]|nr:HAD family phosphatase [Selenomonadaceae bacterium]